MIIGVLEMMIDYNVFIYIFQAIVVVPYRDSAVITHYVASTP